MFQLNRAILLVAVVLLDCGSSISFHLCSVLSNPKMGCGCGVSGIYVRRRMRLHGISGWSLKSSTASFILAVVIHRLGVGGLLRY